MEMLATDGELFAKGYTYMFVRLRKRGGRASTPGPLDKSFKTFLSILFQLLFDIILLSARDCFGEMQNVPTASQREFQGGQSTRQRSKSRTRCRAVLLKK